MQRLFLVILLVLNVFLAKSQNSTSYLSIGYTPGFLLAHRADIKHLAAHNYGLELAYEKKAENTLWGSYYKKPIIGYSLVYHNIGKSYTGHGIGGMMNVKFNVFQIGQTDAKFRMGAGLGYLTEKFDVYNNRRNQAIGSHLNGTMQFAFLFHTEINKLNSYAEYGIGISHYSNAAFTVPNLGYNIPSFFIRYGLGLRKQDTLYNHGPNIVPRPSMRNWGVSASIIYGKKQRNFAAPVNFYNYGIQVKAIRRIKTIKAIRAGVDVTIDKAYKYTEDPLYPLDSVRFMDKLEIGVAAGFQWNFGKVDVYGELGAYVYKPSVLKNPLYQRMGLIYGITEKISLQGALRFHRGVADFFETGITYNFQI